MLTRLLRGPSRPALAGLLIAVLFLLGRGLLGRGALAEPVTYVVAAALGVGLALVMTWRRRREQRTT
jgi:hypothetical protein